MKIEDVKVGMTVIVTNNRLHGYGKEFVVERIGLSGGANVDVWTTAGAYYYPCHIEPVSSVVAWEYSLARAKFLDKDEYCDFGPVQISKDKPSVPEGAVKGLRALVYADA